MLPTLDELGIGFVPFSPLGRGYPHRHDWMRTPSSTDDDFRKNNPRFTAENRAANQALVDHVAALGAARGATPGQVALAWLLAQQPWIVPIPGTRRRSRVEENVGSTAIALSADDLSDLNAVADRIGVHGDRYPEHQMAQVDRG